MPTASYNPNHKDVLDRLLLPILGVRAGKMFGYPQPSDTKIIMVSGLHI